MSYVHSSITNILMGKREISTAHKKLKYGQIKKFLTVSLSDDVFLMLIEVKMPTIIGTLKFMSRIYFVLS